MLNIISISGMQMNTTMRYYFTTTKMTRIIKKSTSVSGVVENSEPSSLLVVLQERAFTIHFGQQSQFFKRLNKELYEPAISLKGNENLLLHKSCITFIRVLIIIVEKWKQPKFSLTDEWINNMYYIHTIKYYSAGKKNEIPKHTIT